MIPIRDHNPSGATPYVTYAIIAANVVVFLGYWPLFSDPRALSQFFNDWAMVPVMVTREGAYLNVLTSMFMHGGFIHLAGNMLFLWIFGDNLEDEMGHFGFLAFYLACGVGAALAQVAAAPYSTVPMVGASGAIAGVMGGYLLMFPGARVDILVIIIFFVQIITVPAWLMLALWFALQLIGGVGMDAAAGGVAHWAHAGGFVLGALLALPVLLHHGGARFWRRTRGHPPHPRSQYRYGRTHVPRVRRRKK